MVFDWSKNLLKNILKKNLLKKNILKNLSNNPWKNHPSKNHPSMNHPRRIIPWRIIPRRIILQRIIHRRIIPRRFFGCFLDQYFTTLWTPCFHPFFLVTFNGLQRTKTTLNFRDSQNPKIWFRLTIFFLL